MPGICPQICKKFQPRYLWLHQQKEKPDKIADFKGDWDRRRRSRPTFGEKRERKWIENSVRFPPPVIALTLVHLIHCWQYRKSETFFPVRFYPDNNSKAIFERFIEHNSIGQAEREEMRPWRSLDIACRARWDRIQGRFGAFCVRSLVQLGLRKFAGGILKRGP